MRIVNAEFITSCALGGTFIKNDVPHIAMVGKSNVGKSSFINSICNRNKLAKVSQTPGKTRLINYFSINSGAFNFVDLPGYGFAKAPKGEIEKWEELMESYLTSGYVNHIFLLLDCRHSPTQLDKQMFSWIQYYCLPFTIILTKIDKLPKYKLIQQIAKIKKEIGSVSVPIGYSSAKKMGEAEVLEKIHQIISDIALT